MSDTATGVVLPVKNPPDVPVGTVKLYGGIRVQRADSGWVLVPGRCQEGHRLDGRKVFCQGHAPGSVSHLVVLDDGTVLQWWRFSNNVRVRRFTDPKWKTAPAR